MTVAYTRYFHLRTFHPPKENKYGQCLQNDKQQLEHQQQMQIGDQKLCDGGCGRGSGLAIGGAKSPRPASEGLRGPTSRSHAA